MHPPSPLQVSCGGREGLVDGWYTRTEVRQAGSTAGSCDTYFFSPAGKRFRSRVEVARHFGLDQGGARAPPAPASASASASASARQPGPVAGLGGDVFRVEALLARRHVGGEAQYLVRWEDYPPEHDSWECEDNIFDESLIRAFNAGAASSSSGGASESAAGPRAGVSFSSSRLPAYLSAPSPGRPRAAPSLPAGRAPSLQGALTAAELPRFVQLASAEGAPGGGVPPPTCLCGALAVLRKRRWWCADEDGGCSFELWACGRTDDGTEGMQPLCECGRPAVWMGRRWWCARADGGCDFEWSPPPPPAPPTLVPPEAIERQMARDTAALLTAAAHGPLNAWSFVAPSDFGLGLWARAPLRRGQALGLYSGPRLPCSLQRRGTCALQIPGADAATACVSLVSLYVIRHGVGTHVVVDGASENCPFSVPRCCASYANHSRSPNARLELWPVLRPAPCELRQHVSSRRTGRATASRNSL